MKGRWQGAELPLGGRRSEGYSFQLAAISEQNRLGWGRKSKEPGRPDSVQTTFPFKGRAVISLIIITMTSFTVTVY